VREPTRHRGGGAASNAELLRFLKLRINILGPHFLGTCCFTTFAYGAGAWMPTILIRVYGWSMAETGYSLGLIALAGVMTGGTAGGLVSQWFFKRGRQDANLLTLGLGFAALIVPATLLGFMPTGLAALFGWMPVAFFNIFHAGPSTAAMQEIVPRRLRGRVAAIYYGANGLLGLSFGAVVVGLVTDRVFQDPMAVAKSISVVAVTLLPVATVLVAIAAHGRRSLGPVSDS
jgi:MFS family permease